MSIYIEDYSAKSFAVYGETKSYKDLLLKLGGKFNGNLKGGPGWIFKLADKKKVQDFIKTVKNIESDEKTRKKSDQTAKSKTFSAKVALELSEMTPEEMAVCLADIMEKLSKLLKKKAKKAEEEEEEEEE